MFTKGEWKHTEDGVIIAKDGKQIASVFPRDRQANALLIASAPDLYEALKDIYDFLKSHGYRTDIIRQALAKAEGK